MALEAIDRYRGIAMATGTESILAQNRLGIGIGMTLDTVRKAMLRGADAFMHGLVALMQDVLHMIAPHLVSRLDAFIAARDIDFRLRYARRLRADIAFRSAGGTDAGAE